MKQSNKPISSENRKQGNEPSATRFEVVYSLYGQTCGPLPLPFRQELSQSKSLRRRRSGDVTWHAKGGSGVQQSALASDAAFPFVASWEICFELSFSCSV